MLVLSMVTLLTEEVSTCSWSRGAVQSCCATGKGRALDPCQMAAPARDLRLYSVLRGSGHCWWHR